jgi:FAD/FMN-containing dehydrogenase
MVMNQDHKAATAVSEGLSRRKFLSGVAGTAALTFIPGKRLYAGSGANTIPTPPNFPSSIPLYQETFTNWALETSISNVWACTPATPADVVTLANWAHANGFRLRPVGSGHGFAPTILPRGSDGANYVLVNSMDSQNPSLKQLTVNAGGSPASVTAQAGVTLEEIALACEPHNLGFLHTPAPGGVSIAGALAMDVHGTCMPAKGQTLQPGHSFGTFSNLVLSLTAVVWDSGSNKYVLKTFQRNDPAIGPLLTCLARTFITEVTIQMGPNLKLRCYSRCDLDPATIFADPKKNDPNCFMALTDQYGSAEVIWQPFSEKTAWIKTWTPEPVKPSTSREVTTPFNYGGSMPLKEVENIASALRNFPSIVPLFDRVEANQTKKMFTPKSGDQDTQIYDLWGSAYCTTFYAPADTLRFTVAAWGVLMSRNNVQRALCEFYTHFKKTLQQLEWKFQHPYTGPVEIRGIGLDRPSDVMVPNAVEPYLSAARPLPDHPDYDTVLWFAINNNVDMPGAAGFNTDLEQWFLSNYSSYAVVRPEWTKTYAYTADGANGGGWTNTQILTQTFPNTFRNHGYPSNSNWDAAVSMLNSYDPNRVFTNPFLDTLMPA